MRQQNDYAIYLVNLQTYRNFYNTLVLAVLKNSIDSNVDNNKMLLLLIIINVLIKQ